MDLFRQALELDQYRLDLLHINRGFKGFATPRFSRDINHFFWGGGGGGLLGGGGGGVKFSSVWKGKVRG